MAGVSRQSFNLEVNAKDYGFEPTDTPRTDRSVEFPNSFVLFFSSSMALLLMNISLQLHSK